MPLKTYQKNSYNYRAYDIQAEPEYIPIQIEPQFEPVLHSQPSLATRQQLTLWDILDSSYHSLQNLVASSSFAGLVIPAFLILGGIALIYQQYSGTINETLRSLAQYDVQGTVPLVQESYLAERLKYVSNPGSDYFKQLTDTAFTQEGFQPDLESADYHGMMYLTIPSLGFQRLPVAANVESGTKEVYDKVLNNSLAHFRGTSLPIATNPHNIVIYGHSASGSYQPNPNDVLAAFSFLSDLKVGDLIVLEVEGKEYSYKMTRSKIVQPDDISIITATPGRESLTLFTCYPDGNSAQRYVAIATPV